MKESLDVLELFQKVSRTVPAYRRFLELNKIKSDEVQNFEDFKSLPITNKKNYLQVYSSDDLFFDGRFPPIVYASSGSSGKPTFWFRGDDE